MQPADTAKREAGYRAAEMVTDGMVVGLGTGSTVLYAMEKISEKISGGIKITGVPTSYQAAIRARALNIPLSSLDDYPVIDLCIDGADQVDPALRLIKGRGAAQTREKCVAAAAGTVVIVVDESKITGKLDAVVPVEVIPFAVMPVMNEIRNAGGMPHLREGVKKDGPVITDNGNFILDAAFGPIADPGFLETFLNCIPGVVTCGLFCGFTAKTMVIVGGERECRVLPRHR
jgi:ribose 5-phosphate isomerase